MLVAQAGVRSLVEWLRSGGTVAATQEISDEVFAAAPRALARSITLTQTVALIKVTIDVAESEVADLAVAGEEEALEPRSCGSRGRSRSPRRGCTPARPSRAAHWGNPTRREYSTGFPPMGMLACFTIAKWRG